MSDARSPGYRRVPAIDDLRTMIPLAPDSGVQAERMTGIREAIASGTYLTDEKLRIAADRLLETLRISLTR